MVLTLHDKKDLVYAYLEWMVVGKDGNPKDYGEYLLVRDLWIHHQYRRGKVIHIFVKMLNEHKFNKNVRYIYWQNLKHGERISRLLTRSQALKKFKL